MTSTVTSVLVPQFSKLVSKPWGYEVRLTSGELPYAAKILHVNAGRRLSLQIHDRKTETMALISGRAVLTIEDGLGQLVSAEMLPNVGYTIHAGQRHRLAALTDCQIAEASTPEVGTTYRLQDDYGRNDETEASRNGTS